MTHSKQLHAKHAKHAKYAGKHNKHAVNTTNNTQKTHNQHTKRTATSSLLFIVIPLNYSLLAAFLFAQSLPFLPSPISKATSREDGEPDYQKKEKLTPVK
jgi:hypothetical protein